MSNEQTKYRKCRVCGHIPETDECLYNSKHHKSGPYYECKECKECAEEHFAQYK